MNDRQLECFVRVAQTKSFRGAAQSMYISQPAVTQQIRSLEELLGTKLFERDTVRVELTENGVRFLAHALPLLRAIREAEAMFQEQRLLTLYYFFADDLGEIARAYRASSPQALLKLVRIKDLADTPSLVDRPGTVTFCDHTLVESIDDLVFHPIWDACEHVLMSTRNPLAQQKSCTVGDLAGQTVLRYFDRTGLASDELTFPRSEDANSNAVDETLGSIIQCASPEEALNMVHADCGVAFFLLPHDVQTPGLAHLPIQPELPRTLGIAYRACHETPEIRALVEAVKATYCAEGKHLML